MKRLRRVAVCFFFLWGICVCARAQSLSRLRAPFLFGAHQKAVSQLPNTHGFQDYIAGGKLRLTLEDAVRLALENNTQVLLNQTQIDLAKDSIQRAHSPFDIFLRSSFNDQRSVSQQYTQLNATNQLNQSTSASINETLETGTSYNVSFNANKFSSNSLFNIFNPAISTGLAFDLTQPLLRGGGLFINRAPIVIAQRNLNQTRDTFEAEVNDTVLQVISQYWSVVAARQNLVVQNESLDQAQRTYDHDKHSLDLGALAPPDIHRSEAQVAARKLSVIQARYSLTQAEDQFRQFIGADVDPAVRALDLDLAETPEPTGALAAANLQPSIQKALSYRPEMESIRLQLLNDDTNTRLAHNSLEPNLSITGTYSTSGLNAIVANGVTSAGSFGDAINQMFGFRSPTYGFTLSLSLPVRDHAAEASLGDALVSKKRDLYAERSEQQAVTLEVTNAVHQLDESKASIDAAKASLKFSQQTLQADQHKYDLGAGDVFFVLNDQLDVAQAEQGLLQAQINYQLSVAALQHATGTLLDQYRVQFQQLTK